MVSSDADNDLADLLRRHAELDANHGDGNGGNFLSGWQCDNPWIDKIQSAVGEEAGSLPADRYIYSDDDQQLKERLFAFHNTFDQIHPEALICGPGSSAILFTICAWLHERGVREVYFVPPLYFAFHWALRLFGIRARAVSGRHAFEDSFSMNLPDHPTILLLSDPVWYAGMTIADAVIDQLKNWQRRTNSVIITDGSFQYTRWSGHEPEGTASFDPRNSLRLICPSKALASHGYRFAYATLPNAWHRGMAGIQSNIYGSTSIENIAFARVAAAMMLDGEVPTALVDLVARRHALLRAAGTLSAPWQPNSGYFVFEKLGRNAAQQEILMDGSFFGQPRYPGYYRVNLLSPSIGLLD